MTSTPRTFGVGGHEFEIDQPFTEGQQINAAEASALNQLYIENIRNNVRESVKKWTEEGKTRDEMQAEIDKVCDAYEFGAKRGGGRRVHDPVLREMRKLAVEAITPLVAKQGGSWNNLSSEEKEALIGRYLAKFDEPVRNAAVARIEAAKGVTGAGFEL